nr:reverse transcriptase domain-containing protein, chloroplastic [Tanacetum cinerariifolium]
MNEINIKARQTKSNNVKNELRNEIKTWIQASMSNQTNELKNMMASFFQMITTSTLGSRPLPSNTIANLKGKLKAITTRSGLVLDGLFVPMPHPFINLKEDESVILKKLPEKLEDPRKFFIPCGFSELKCKALANLVINPISGSTTSSSPNPLLEEFAYELALITFPPGNDDLPFDIESDLREIEYLLHHDPTKEMVFTDEHTLDYSSPPLYDDFDDDLDEFESDNEYVYDDPFDTKEDKINESKLLIDELDHPRSSDFLPSLEYDSFLIEDFFEVDALPLTNNEDKVFNSGILIHENRSKVIIQATPDKNIKKISISHASLILEDLNLPLSYHELPFHKEVLGSKILLLFSFKNEEKFSNPGFSLLKEFILLFPWNYLIGALKFSKSLKFLKD